MFEEHFGIKDAKCSSNNIKGIYPGNHTCKCLHCALWAITNQKPTVLFCENYFNLGHTSFMYHEAFQKLGFLKLRLSFSEESK